MHPPLFSILDFAFLPIVSTLSKKNENFSNILRK